MTTSKWLSLAVLGLVASACDPYENTKSGTPTLLSATATDLANGVAYAANAVGDTVTINIDCAAVAANLCPGYDPTDPDADQFSDFTDLTELAVFITFDRQIDGAAVQTGLNDCTPKGGWLTATPAPTGGDSWYSCYNPSAPSPSEGGSAVVFTATNPAAPATISGWGDYSPLPAAPTPINITGTLAGRTVNVTVNRVDVAATCDAQTATLCQ